MPLHLSPALETDAPRIAAIHMAAFGTNAMLLAQFPTPTVRAKLQTRIAAKALADIRDPNIAVLVVRDDDENDNGNGDDEVVSFAKWSLPVREGEADVEAPWVWPEGTDLAVLDGWSGVVEGAKGRVVGEGACYREFCFRAIYLVPFSRVLVYRAFHFSACTTRLLSVNTIIE